MIRRTSFIAALALAAVSGGANAEHTRLTNPNALSLEVLGRGISYSVSFDRVVSDELAGGIGIGRVGTGLVVDGGDELSSMAIPIYLNYYLTRDAGSLYLTAGATLLTEGSALEGQTSKIGGVELPSSGMMPTFGIGYENRGDYGFLLRVAAYGLVADKITPWLGFSLGYAF